MAAELFYSIFSRPEDLLVRPLRGTSLIILRNEYPGQAHIHELIEHDPGNYDDIDPENYLDLTGSDDEDDLQAADHGGANADLDNYMDLTGDSDDDWFSV